MQSQILDMTPLLYILYKSKVNLIIVANGQLRTLLSVSEISSRSAKSKFNNLIVKVHI